MSTLMVKELELIDQFRDLIMLCERTSDSVMLGMLKVTSDFLTEIRENQMLDLKLVNTMLAMDSDENRDFEVDDIGVLRFRGRICIPDDPNLKNMILEESHKNSLSIHPRATKMYHDLKKFFWWSGMKRDVARFVYACLTCQKSKVEHQRPSGLMQPLEIPEWNWDNISMDFVTGLPNTVKGFHAIWVIMDRLKKSAHFIPIDISYSLQKLADLYISVIVKLHGVSSSIVSDRDMRFTSDFWKSLYEALCSNLKLSSTYHPQMDG